MSTTSTPETHPAHHTGHEEQHMQSPAILTDIVIGMSDGLTVPFALAAGLSGMGVAIGIRVARKAAALVAE